MSVLTESELRRTLKNKDLNIIKELEVSKNQIITPSAMSFLNEHNISLKFKDSSDIEKANISLVEILPEERVSSTWRGKYKTIFGVEIEEKPEYMTVVYDDIVVFKDDKRIVFRGKMELLEEHILKAQIHCVKEKLIKLLRDLEEVIVMVRKIKASEILKEPLPEIYLQAMNENDIREKSTNISKYFHVDDAPLSYDMGETVIILNELKIITRETEISAYEAFKEKYGGVEREDIIMALNRLSSLFNIMIYKYRAGKYKD